MTAKPAHRKQAEDRLSHTMRNESALLVNPFDFKHIVGVEEITRANGLPAISARVSFDGGQSWRESWPMPTGLQGRGVVGPVLAVDAHGILILAALAQDGEGPGETLVVYRSDDGGIHWSPPETVLEGSQACCYSVAADLNPESVFRGSVYIAAEFAGRLRLAYSRDSAIWNTQFVSEPCYNPELVVDAHGGLHAIWMTEHADGRILLVCSTDGGNRFSLPVTVAQGVQVSTERLPGATLATCITRDGIAVCAWADDREGRSRIYYRRSLDGGRHWLGPSSGAPLLGGHSSAQEELQPHLIVTAHGEICCAYYEYGPREVPGDALVDLVMSVSYDGGETFTERMVLSASSWDPTAQEPLSRNATRGALGWLAVG
jgi:hypothetical protein